MPVDLTPEALDAQIERLRIRGAKEHERSNHYVRRMEIERHEAADTIAALRAQLEAHADEYAMACKEIAALRAAPVAMRERAAEVAENKRTLTFVVEHYGTDLALSIAAAIRALPLDAPVDYNPSLRGQRNFPDLFVEPAGFGRPAFTDEEAPPADPYLDAPAPVDSVAEAARVLLKAGLDAPLSVEDRTANPVAAQAYDGIVKWLKAKAQEARHE
jgi:hypothetical protein